MMAVNNKWIFIVLFSVLGFSMVLFGLMTSLYFNIKSLERQYEEDIGSKDTVQTVIGGASTIVPSADDLVAIRLSASQEMMSFKKSDGSDKSFFRINIWNRGPVENEHFRVVDNSEIEVLHGGSYIVYAQLSMRKKGGMTSFSILKSGADEENSVLSQYVASFTTSDYATLETGYTAVVAELQRGDKISLAVTREDFSIDFREENSFLGIAGLTG